MTAMFRAVLYTQWKWSRLIVVLGTLAAFAIPLLSLQGAARADRGALQAQDLLRSVQSWGSLYPLLATGLGLLMAIAAWAPEDRKSTRLNSSHQIISYAVFCLKKKTE